MKKKTKSRALLWAMISGFMIQAVIPEASVYASVKSGMHQSMRNMPRDVGECLSDASPSNASPSNASGTDIFRGESLRARASSTGNLWDDWEGDTDFPGEGTKESPFQIGSLAQLMGLSELVAAGNTFKGTYFELVRDIDLGNLTRNNGSWNPIGWYQEESQMGGDLSCGFSGNFDGCGNTIKGLRIHRSGTAPDYAGLFGLIDGGSVTRLTIQADEVYGGNLTGVLAGMITGNCIIRDVQVSGYVRATGDAGGIAGAVDGREGRATVENCRAQGIAILSEGGSSFTGGIAGWASGADLVDNVVMTQNGDGDRIRGNGYVGGITGRMDDANLYNSYVEGTIGGNGGKAVGGMVGMYESGNLILARFAGDIGRTGGGTAAREGTFVGVRRGMFTYGTEKGSNLSYLYTNTSGKTKNVFGSDQDGDNLFTSHAHIGYWTDNGKKYVTVAGITENNCGDRYFYEELEDGVRYLVTQKLEKEFTAENYAKGLSFKLDHFAPGYQGEPVKGYLLSVPRIDALNANGTYDTDVASLSAVPAGSNTYYRTFTKDHCGAVAPGVTVSVATAAKNTGDNRYQMVVDGTEAGGVRPPSYINEAGEKAPMTYVNGGTYSFQMPERDTEINAEYVKVTTQVLLNPAETTISVTQTRKGDRKNPDILTEVRDQGGILIARYINDQLDTALDVQPVRIHGEHNKTGSTADQSLAWSVDDANLLTLDCPTGYSREDAAVMPNLDSSFIQGILNREIEKQADHDYLEPISPVVYDQSGVVTAASNPETSADGRAVYGNCKVTVTFQILDQTTRRVEGLDLNETDLVCRVTRKLTGDRKDPHQEITCSGLTILAAELYPQQPFYKNVTWKDKESGQIIRLTPSGDHQENCDIEVRFDPEGKANPAWIQNVIQADNQIKKEDPYRKLEGKAVYEEEVTATAQDQTHGVVSGKCKVTIEFVTEDETEIWPEKVNMEPWKKEYNLSVVKTGDSSKPVVSYQGFDGVKLSASFLPEVPDEEPYRPYASLIRWSSSDSGILGVTKDGTISPSKNASWIGELLNTASSSGTRKAQATKTVLVWAEADQGQAKSAAEITLHLTAEDKTVRYTPKASGSSSSGRIKGSSDSGPGVEAVMKGNSLSYSGSGSPSLVLEGQKGQWGRTAEGDWTFTINGRMCRDEWVYAQNPYADTKKGQSSLDWFRFDSQGRMVIGWYMDKDGLRYYLNPISDNTKGRMMTGWNWIMGNDRWLRCYYFQENSDGKKGSLFKSKTTPDGYSVNEEGEWTVKEQVQRK